MKAYTDIKQSKKLAEILPIKSADCYWDYDEMQKFHRISWFEDGYNKESQLMLNENNVCAWSLAALEGLMPFQIIKNNERFGFYQVKGFNKQGETYRFGYKTNNDSFLFETSWYNDVIDAAFEMICWLKKNNKI